MMSEGYWLICPVIGFLLQIVQIEGCGPFSHLLISHRARTYFKETGKTVDYGKLMTYHTDAFQAGSIFPDSFYSSLCKGGNFSQISEDTHWTPFLKTAVDYIRNKYPQPWDQSTEKLVVFILGIMSHQISDVLWYSLGIEHGFVATLAAVDFHGNYSAAREVADLGADVLNQWNYVDYTIIHPVRDWYLPTEDLYNIYMEFYGSEKIDKDTLDECAALPFLTSVVEGKTSPEVYQMVANLSPFLINNMEDYFVGGMSDMVAWTYRSWQNGISLFENGTSSCQLPKNPLFIRCNTPNDRSIDKPTRQNKSIQSNLASQYKVSDIEKINIERQKTLRGTVIRQKNDGKLIKKEKKMKRRSMMKQRYTKSKKIPPRDGTYAVNSSYAKFGWSIETGDLDLDGYVDIIIGAPGYNVLGSVQEGRVYILYGNGSESAGFDYSFHDIDVPSHFNPLYGRTTVIDGFSKKQSRFGSGVAVLDINLDGILDIAVGAPAYWIDNPLEYKGLISIYLGKGKGRRQYGEVDIAISCQSVNCNLGYKLEAGDLDGDGNADLIMGLPFYTGAYNQSGIVAALMASRDIPVKKTIAFETIKWRQQPDKQQSYAWFGFNLKIKQQTLLASSPNVRKCANPLCNVSPLDVLNVGRLDVFNYGNKSKIENRTLIGQNSNDFAGFSADFGTMYDNVSVILCVGYSGMTVSGSYVGLSINVTRAGSVTLYNMSDPSSSEIARFDGSTRYGRFGSYVMVSDINGDGTDDLLIGEPHRNKNKFETKNEEDGTVYVYYGGKTFPRGNPTVTNCSDINPCPENSANFKSFTNFGGVNNGYKAKVVNTTAGQVLFTTDIRYPWSETVMWSGFRSGGVHYYVINRY